MCQGSDDLRRELCVCENAEIPTAVGDVRDWGYC